MLYICGDTGVSSAGSLQYSSYTLDPGVAEGSILSCCSRNPTGDVRELAELRPTLPSELSLNKVVMRASASRINNWKAEPLVDAAPGAMIAARGLANVLHQKSALTLRRTISYREILKGYDRCRVPSVAFSVICAVEEEVESHVVQTSCAVLRE